LLEGESLLFGEMTQPPQAAANPEDGIWRAVAGWAYGLRSVVFLAVLTGLIAGCVPATTEIPSNPTFPGMLSPDVWPDAPTDLRVFFVPGMGIQDRGDADGLMAGLAKRLSLVPKTIDDPNQIDNRPDPNDMNLYHFVRPKPTFVPYDPTYTQAPAELYVYNFVTPPGNPTKPAFNSMQFAFLLWSPTTAKFKYGDLAEYGHPSRAWANDWAKQFIQTRISDPILYIGTYRKILRGIVEDALCRFIGGGSDRQDACSSITLSMESKTPPTILIGHSQGSYMIMDALTDLADSDQRNAYGRAKQAVAHATFISAKFFYMLANQLALLDLSTVPAPSSAEDARHPSRSPKLLHDFAARWSGAQGGGRSGHISVKQIIAISDPNDILSFLVSPDEIGDSNIPVYNVYLPNVEDFGLYADVWNAHVGYLTNRQDVDVIACGMTDGVFNPCPP
jgi:hypothetical protein